ncbi:MAG: transposase [Coprococcus sp.]|nr:transposase [Coprococcus sp.]
MPPDTICKTVHQYSSSPIPEEDMRKLLEIADDYAKVKNYVYIRYGGIGSLSKLYPGYTIQNEMTASGMRETLKLPSVYFYLAVFDALGDIKSQWTKAKSKVQRLVSENENFTQEEKHYLWFLLRVNNAFEAVLEHRAMMLPKDIQRQHDELAGKVDFPRLQRYLCRQVRRNHTKCGKQSPEGLMDTKVQGGFAIAERAYRYADHGIYISTKERRKRVFVPLTDNNQYKSQLYIKLYPEENRIEIKAPVNVAVRQHEDYCNEVGIALGMFTLVTTDGGREYGTELGRRQIEYADWIREQTKSYNRNREANAGRKKYTAKKKRLEEQLHSYINHELNRFLIEERPRVIYITKTPKPQGGGINRKINNSVNLWQRGYIRSRIGQKCKEQSVKIIEVLGKDISRECSRCGAIGNKKEGIFSCVSCGYAVKEKENTARNVLKRGREGKVIKQAASGVKRS